MAASERLTYRQIADRFGLATPDAGRMKAKREEAKGRWTIDRGNHPGATVYVEIPLEDIPAAPPERAEPSPPTPATEPPTPDVSAFAPIAAELEAQRIRADTLADRLIEEATSHAATRAELELADRAGMNLTERLKETRDALAKERARGWFDKLWNG